MYAFSLMANNWAKSAISADDLEDGVTNDVSATWYLHGQLLCWRPKLSPLGQLSPLFMATGRLLHNGLMKNSYQNRTFHS